MKNSQEFHVAVMGGDGIGPEVMAPCVELLERLSAHIGGFSLRFEDVPCGAGYYLKHGVALSDENLKRAAAADAILLGAAGLPDVRYPDGREIAPQIDIRIELELFAGVRPVRSIPGLAGPLGDPRAQKLDFVLIRESTEGLFASMGKTRIVDDKIAYDTMEITRPGSERLFDFSFELARKRKERGSPGILTCVDKANVFGGFAFFRKIFRERAEKFPYIEARVAYVDATALNMVRNPWVFDVIATENMFGDILSDLGAGLMGGMGVAPSADIGPKHAVFQPCHGTAPDIMGSGKANPTAMFLSAAMMLDWLGDRHDVPKAVEAGRILQEAVDKAFAPGDLRPCELGGSAGLKEITARVSAALEKA